jgi:peptidoglycan glycosyltransferase
VNKKLQRLGIFLVMCFIAVFVKLQLTQLVEADELATKPDNQRETQRKYNQPRGQIISADGVVLAKSTNVGGNMIPRERSYPEGDLFGHITGFYSGNYGTQLGVEKSYNDALAGDTARQQIDGLTNGLTNLFAQKENVGNVSLTVRKDLQQLARDQLGDREGAITVLDPRTGAILAMWSNPSYDPNQLMITREHSLAQVKEAYALYNANPQNPMLAKAYRNNYPPGSSFKPVTATGGLAKGTVTLTTPVYPELETISFRDSDKPIANFGSPPEKCGGVLYQVLTVSCNTAFAQMGVDQSIETLSDTAKGFGWNQDVQIDMPGAAKSTIPTKLSEVGIAGTGQNAIGQQHNTATPLQIALVAAGIANGGVVMKPHVMYEVRNQDATVVDRYKPQPWLTAMSPEVNAQMRQVMLGPVNDPNGTAKGQINVPAGMVAGGKTGTAQTGTGLLHTWFMGYAGPAGGTPKVAVSVVVLKQRVANDVTGGRISAPIANVMLNEALKVVDSAQVDPTSVIVTPTTSVPPAGPFAPGAGGPQTTATVPTTRREGG